MKVNNQQLKEIQKSLQDIIDNIAVNMDMIQDEEIKMTFLQPIMKSATDISDKVFIQTRNTIHEINL